MMFDKEYSFRGKHAEYVVKLTAEYDDKHHKLFNTNYDVYAIAPIIGFLYQRKAELDKTGDATKIFPDKLIKEQQNLVFNYRLIMLLDEKNEPDFNERSTRPSVITDKKRQHRTKNSTKTMLEAVLRCFLKN